mmetsp:Transcript_34145/g.90227  ORF Transcript_34145/g.90227 Transcript_34145/m.90227 type:complete len:132 (+) Transcript_34145:313-708(+)
MYYARIEAAILASNFQGTALAPRVRRPSLSTTSAFSEVSSSLRHRLVRRPLRNADSASIGSGEPLLHCALLQRVALVDRLRRLRLRCASSPSAAASFGQDALLPAQWSRRSNPAIPGVRDPLMALDTLSRV